MSAVYPFDRHTLLSCAALLLAGGCSRDASAATNLILISIDTLRPDHLGCYGYERDTSPTIDRIAAEGTLFRDCTASSPWTLPSHATMLTGLYPSHHGVREKMNRLPAETITLAEELAARGFRTHAIVNAYNVAGPFQLDQGFEEFHYVPESRKDRRGRPRIVNTGAEVVARAEAFLATRGPERFFLFLHFYDVHTDFTPREEYRARFVDPYEGVLTGNTTQLLAIRERGDALSEADLRFLRQMYDAEIRQLDDLLGDFLGRLRRSGLLDDTLLVITSDHGEEFMEHGGLLHGRTQYQELLAIPLILRGPGVPSGRIVAAPVGLVDLFPTALSLLAVPTGTRHDGLDLTAHWRTPTAVRDPRILYGEADHNNVFEGRKVHDTKAMVRIGSDKLCFDKLTQRRELYDLSTDPGERDDLAAAEAATAERLHAELQRFLSSAVDAEGTRALSPDEESLLEALGYGGGDD